MPSLSHRSASNVPAKRTLFCGRCGHESPATDGDWDYRSTTDGTGIHCPDCGAVLTVRPGEQGVTLPPIEPSSRPAPLLPSAVGGRFVARSLDLATLWAPLVAASVCGDPWRTTTAWPCDLLRGDRRGR
jgi:DNA-directed RNA polymerase subunit RPC12/RpoP